MTQLKTASLFRNGRNQAVRIPVEFEMPGTEVTIRKEGDKLVLEPKAAPKTFAELFSQMETIDIEFPDVDEGLLPLRDIVL
ncbi:MAG TPA: AbrB/MazE/SpoVT family DNA-binding domain-containing protein [Devosia sp.]|nr:AbrB/MazE/SpoVT family DNA-binding domain-containing protein [Devosia sp.]